MYIYLFFIMAFINYCNAEFIEVKLYNASASKGPKIPDLLTSLSKYKNLKSFFKDITGIDEQNIIDAWTKKDLATYNDLIKSIFEPIEKSDLKTKLKKFLDIPDIQNIALSYIGNFLKNISTKQEFQVGNFAQFTLDDLGKVEASGNSGSFNVKAGFSLTSVKDQWYADEIDIGILQAKKENQDAIFQVASLCNVLLPPGNSFTGEKIEDGITNYYFDKGKVKNKLLADANFSSLSTAPGLIYRMYYIFQPIGTPQMWRQTKDRQVNLLDLLSNEYPVLDGEIYLSKVLKPIDETLNINDDTEYAKILPNQIDIGKVKIGYIPDIQVTYNASGNFIYDTSQTINQVYTTFIFGSLGNNRDFTRHPDAIKKAQALIMAAYTGAIRLAALFKKTKLYLNWTKDLMILSGFLYPTWISDAILKNKEFIKRSNIDVTLIFDNFFYISKYPGSRILKKQLLELTDYCNGKFIIYKDDGAYQLKLSDEKNIASKIDDFYSLRLRLSLIANIS